MATRGRKPTPKTFYKMYCFKHGMTNFYNTNKSCAACTKEKAAVSREKKRQQRVAALYQ